MIFMGTPETAAYTLELLVKSGFPIKMVVTTPDKPVGRGQNTVSSPVKVMAETLGIRVEQPSSVHDDEFVALLQSLSPEFIVVIAYGKILPQRVLDVPTRACINVHYSLLPLHRGASPVHHAILSGDEKTGVTTMLMTKGMDEGDILQQRSVSIGDATTPELLQTLTTLGGSVLVETVKNFDAILPKPQDNANATYTPIIKKTDGVIDWSINAETIARMVRAYTPWPSAHTTLADKVIKVTAAKSITHDNLLNTGINADSFPTNVPCGTIVHASPKGSIVVVCGNETLLQVSHAQIEGRRNMPVQDILNSNPNLLGVTLGAAADDANRDANRDTSKL